MKSLILGIVASLYFALLAGCAGGPQREQDATFDRSGRVDPIARAVVSLEIAWRPDAGKAAQRDAFRRDHPKESDALDYLFDRPDWEQPRPSRTSGFLIAPDGYILCAAAEDRARMQSVTAFVDGKAFPAEIIGSDRLSSLMLLRIGGHDLPSLSFAATGGPPVDARVYALARDEKGDLRFRPGKILRPPMEKADDGGVLQDFILSNADIRPGDGGGPLLSLANEVVGVNLFLLKSDSARGPVAFALRAETASWVAEQLRNQGAIRRGALGLVVQPVTAQLAGALGMPFATGALVHDVEAGSAAASVDLKRGDVILNFNGVVVNSPNHLNWLLNRTTPGEEVLLRINRLGEIRSVTAVLGTRDADS